MIHIKGRPNSIYQFHCKTEPRPNATTTEEADVDHSKGRLIMKLKRTTSAEPGLLSEHYRINSHGKTTVAICPLYRIVFHIKAPPTTAPGWRFASAKIKNWSGAGRSFLLRSSGALISDFQFYSNCLPFFTILPIINGTAVQDGWLGLAGNTLSCRSQFSEALHVDYIRYFKTMVSFLILG